MREKFLSSSMIGDYYTCKRKFNYRYNTRIVPLQQKEALQFGTLLHLALYTYYKTKDKSAVMDMVRKEIDKIDRGFLDAEAIKELDDMENMIDVLCTAYFQVYGDEMAQCEVLEAETRHRLKIGRKGSNIPYFEYTPDMVIKIGDEVKIIDFKSTSRIDSVYLDKFDFAYQTLFYSYALNKKYKPKTFEYRVLKKPSIRQTQKETKEQFRTRLRDVVWMNLEDYIISKKINIDSHLLSYAKSDLMQIKKDIGNGLKSRIYPKNTSACSIFGRCQYFDLCHRGWNDTNHLYKTADDNYTGGGEVVVDE